jgi:transposase
MGPDRRHPVKAGAHRTPPWLYQGGFTWPPIRDGVVYLSATQLTMLLDGLDWTRASPKPVR